MVLTLYKKGLGDRKKRESLHYVATGKKQEKKKELIQFVAIKWQGIHFFVCSFASKGLAYKATLWKS